MLQVSDFSISLPARMGERTQPACLRCPRSPAGRTPSPPGAASRGGSTHAQKPTCENSNEWQGHDEQTFSWKSDVYLPICMVAEQSMNCP